MLRIGFRFTLILVVLVSTTSCIASQTPKKSFIPTSAYSKHVYDGVNVLISPEVTSNKELEDDIKSTLKEHISVIKRIIPRDKFNKIQSTNIWVELRAQEKRAAEFHVDIEWLKSNGYNPEKVMGIEIPNVSYYLETTIPGKQQYSLLHEFTHALHELLTKEQHKLILDTYKKAKSTGLYRSVTRFAKTYRRDSYALSDEYEYLAELTEAYFGINDWFPHTRYQLKDYDPKGYELIEKIWNS